MRGRNDKKLWIKASYTIMLVKAKPSAEVAEDSEDQNTPNTAESEG